MNAISAVLLAAAIGAALAYVVWFWVRKKRDDNPDGSVQLPMNFGNWSHGKLKMYAMGLLMTSMRGLVMPVFGLPVPVEEQVKVGFFILVAVVIGFALGSVGAIFGLAFRKWRGRGHSTSG